MTNEGCRAVSSPILPKSTRPLAREEGLHLLKREPVAGTQTQLPTCLDPTAHTECLNLLVLQVQAK